MILYGGCIQLFILGAILCQQQTVKTTAKLKYDKDLIQYAGLGEKFKHQTWVPGPESMDQTATFYV